MSLNNSPSQRPEQLSTQPSFDFEYGKLDTETRIVVQQCTREIKSLMRRTAQDIINIGQKLIEVRKQLGYGKFRKWLKAEFDWSASTATKFIQVAERFSCVNFTQLKIAASALYLLAKPSTLNDARLEALDRASQGETITHAVVKEIISRHKGDAAYMPEQTTITVTAKALEQQSSAYSIRIVAVIAAGILFNEVQINSCR